MNIKIFLTLMTMATVIGCSQEANSDQSGGSNSATVAAPTVSYTGSPYTFYNGVTITSQTPSITGSNITGCTISPALPAGLTISNTTCTISGTPTANAVAGTYTITISNAAGSATASITITVSTPPVPTISYAGAPFNFPLDIAISSLTPTLTGTTITNCTIAPALPAGLTLSSTSCVISGTPTASQTSTAHTVTVTTAGGTGTATFNIVAGKRIFVTASNTPNGNLASGYANGIAGADAFCAADANKPTSGTYKALLVDTSASPNRRACLNANCSSGPGEGIDWVLKANTAYFRTDFTHIGTTTSNKIFAFPLINSFQSGASPGQTVWMTFFSDWRSGGVDCSQWTSSSNGIQGGVVDPTVTNSGAISGGGASCNNTSRKLVCVEQ